jgi:hypothetical protein
VCSATGHKADAVAAIQHWVDNVTQLIDQGKLETEPIVLFPVVACNGAVAPCHPWITGSGLAYPVVKLQGFWVKESWDGQQARKQPNCHFTRRSADVFCIHLQTTGSDMATSGGRPLVRLVD